MVVQPNMGVSLPEGMGVIDLGDGVWTYYSQYQRFHGPYIDDYDTTAAYYNCVCPIYICNNEAYADSNRSDMRLSVSAGKRIFVRNFAYTDVASFKAAMSGVLLFYKKATT